MKLRLIAPKTVFEKNKIIDSVADKKLVTLNFKDVDIPKKAGEFQLLANTLTREWPYVLSCISQLSKEISKHSSLIEFIQNGCVEIFNDIEDYKTLADKNTNYPYSLFTSLYKIITINKFVPRLFVNPEVEAFRRKITDVVECGYIPNMIDLFQYKFYGVNTEYFKLQINLFEMINTMAKRKISMEVLRYFPREITASKLKPF